ncbi:urea ABC transporter permease subunit UrtB [Roseovarius sp. 10]|uniref:urea ABC transporter permease subunit UrtB n=1 Tax=Roseovarius sp. 10 TaxID=3080563 RepID=UPI0029558828|nr:urea ABC transporter permease subunit UrtB [Roseovarius sp. 10]MDV7202421.1 urea ABC transporter permease subunit UrtB [Roseovarius sp. 10]
MPFVFFFILFVPLFAKPVFSDRAMLVEPLCITEISDQVLGLQQLARIGLDRGINEVAWAQTVVSAVGNRSLSCSAEGVYISQAETAVDAVSLAPTTLPVDAFSPPVNNRVRATAASAEAILKLFSLTEGLAERLQALSTLERRREALTVEVLNAATEYNNDLEVLQGIEALRAQMLLDDPDPNNRIIAIEAIAQQATLRNRTLIEEQISKESDAQVIEAGEAAISSIDRELAIGRILASLYSGVSYASVLLLAALGLAIIFGLMGVINLAQGEFIMIGAYAAWFVQNAIRSFAPNLLDWYLLAALPISFMAAALVGLIMEALVLRRLYDRPLMTLLATWAVSLLLINTVRITIGTQNLEFYQPIYVSGGIPVVGDFIMTWNRLFAIALACAAFASVVATLRFTTFGMNVRAVAQNRAMAGAVGIDTRGTDRRAIALGSGLAGLAGVALAPLYNVNPNMGAGFIVDSFIVVVLGGVGSLVGTVVASFGIGQINVIMEPIYGAVAAKVVVLLLVIAFIQRRPEGFFAPKGRR